MLDSIIITGILLLLAAGGLAVGLAKLLLRKSIFFKIVAVLTFPIMNAVFMGFLIGIWGFEHAVWIVPWGVFLILAGYFMAARVVQRPLNEMIKKVESLSEGNLNFVIDKKFLKGNTETARVMRRLAGLAGSFEGIAAFAEQVGKGNLNVEYRLLGENDTLGKAMLGMRANLLKAEEEMEKSRRSGEQRNWATQGLAKFAEILRKDNDNLETLSYNIIVNLVKYVGANQGGLFIMNEDEQVLEMKACFAFDRKKFADMRIPPGEGLVGACYWEGDMIYMTDIPKTYINITSGLGDSTPTALVICPMKVNDEIYGVIELASFKEFEPHQLEFVQKVCESIASTIGAVKVNIRTNALLEQSRFQAEEMANQEEELRQNMEEMQATQEEMYRREAELNETLEQMREVQSRMEAVGNNLPNGVMFRIIRYKNNPETMCMDYVSAQWEKITGLTHESVKRDMKPFRALVHPDDNQPLTDAIVESISSGTFSVEIRIKRNDSYRWLRIVAHTHSDEKRLMWDGIMTDVTARKEAEKKFIAEKNLMEAVGNNLPNGVIYRLVRDNNNAGKMYMDYVSAQWESITGLKPETVREDMSPFFASVHPDDLQPLIDATEESITTRALSMEIRFRYGDSYRWLRIIAHPHSDEKRKIWDGIITDITARKKSERFFEEKVHWYESLLDAFYETPISVTDMDKKVTFLNKAALDILGKTREEVIGRHCGDVWDVDICKDHRCGIECMKRGEGKSVFHVGDQTFTTFASYIKDLNGNNIGHIEVVSNITEETRKSN